MVAEKKPGWNALPEKFRSILRDRQNDCAAPVLLEQSLSTAIKPVAETRQRVRKLIAFDDDTFDKLKQLGRDRMATIQELADEAFTDLLRKHNIPIDLKDALRKSAAEPKTSAKPSAKSSTRKPKS
jgi:non-homologous end joining protein Ku